MTERTKGAHKETEKKESTLRRGCISGQLQANATTYKMRMRDKSRAPMTAGSIR